MRATNLEGRINGDGSIDLRFSTDLEVSEAGLAPEAAEALLAVALEVGPDLVAEHDGFRLALGRDGLPALSFRFGQGRWLSIQLGPEDRDILLRALRDR